VQETQCSLFPIYCRLPKLDVVGSNPISRSNFFQQVRRQWHFPDPKSTILFTRYLSEGEGGARTLRILSHFDSLMSSREGWHSDRNGVALLPDMAGCSGG
jgi:hypothetical protein